MDVLNMNDHAVHPRVIAPNGAADTVTVMAKRRVTLPEGYSVDQNWVAATSGVRIYDSRTSRNATAIGAGIAAMATRIAAGTGVPAAQITAPVGFTANSDAIRAAQAAALAQSKQVPVTPADPETN